MPTIRIRVCDRHIRKGIRDDDRRAEGRDCTVDAMTMAIHAATDNDALILLSAKEVVIGARTCVLPKSAREWLRRYYAGEQVEPFSFDLEVPA
jgi:hypothetical protein